MSARNLPPRTYQDPDTLYVPPRESFVSEEVARRRRAEAGSRKLRDAVIALQRRSHQTVGLCMAETAGRAGA